MQVIMIRARARPPAHPGGAGLLWAINGGRLVELHRDWEVIKLAANGSRHVFERRRVVRPQSAIRGQPT